MKSALLLLILCAVGCSRAEQPIPTLQRTEELKQAEEPKQTQTPSPNLPKKHTLSFETGLVLKSGDVKPVARADFYLLNRDFRELAILRRSHSSLKFRNSLSK